MTPQPSISPAPRRAGAFSSAAGAFFRRAGAGLARHPAWTLGVVYAAAVLLRWALLLQTAILPSVMADEMLYMQLANSLHAGEGLLVRGQPIAYPYFLYPLLLSPLFSLPKSVNLYQAIFCLNAALIHLTIFPTYALARELTGKRGAALVIACAVALMPDMGMSRHIMAESLAYPLLAATLLCVWRLLNDPRGRAGALLGALGALAYLLKPGYAAVAGVGAVVCVVCGLRKGQRGLLLSGVLAAAALAAGAAAGLFIARTLLGAEAAQTLYERQARAFSLDHLWQTVVGSYRYLVYVAIAFGFVPFAALFSGARAFSGAKWRFCAVVLGSLLALIVGTVYVIAYDELQTTGTEPLRVHVRYMAYLLPAMAALLCSDELLGRRMRVPLCVMGAAMAAGVFLFPSTAFTYGTVDAALLAGMRLQSGAWNGLVMYLPIAFALALPICGLIAWKGLTRELRAAAMALLLALLAGNQAAQILLDQYAMNTPLAADAGYVAYETDGDALYVCGEGEEQNYEVIALEVASRCAVKPVTLAALVRSTDADGGVTRVMPAALDRHLQVPARNSYPKPAYLVFKPDILNRVRLSDAVTFVSVSKYGNYELYALPETDAWLHSGVFGLNEGWVWEGSGLIVCDDAILNSGGVTLWLKLRAGVDGAVLTLTAPDGQTRTLAPSAAVETMWYSATFQTGGAAPFVVGLSHAEGNIFVETYAVEGGAGGGV